MNRTRIAVFAAFFAAFSAAASFAQTSPTPTGADAPPPAAPAAPPTPAPAADKPLTTTVAAVTGNAEYRLNDKDAWKPIVADAQLPVGAELRTGIRGEVKLQVGPNAHIDVERLTYMVIGQLQQDGDTLRTLLAVQHGKVHFKIDHVGFRNDFKIATPTGTMAVKGTEGDLTSDTGTDITGNEDNGGNAINYTDSNGDTNNYTGGDSTDNQGGTTTGNSSQDTGNSNTGDGNGNGSGQNSPDTGALGGNTSNENSQQQIQTNTPPNEGGDY
ncbi:MAG: FecR domain-containing protein [Phycisphaeraceae bacterium]